MISLGIDPDLHRTAIAAISQEDTLPAPLIYVEGWIVKTPTELTGIDAVKHTATFLHEALESYTKNLPFRREPGAMRPVIAIEGQHINLKRTRNPKSILQLALVSGAAIASVSKIPNRLVLVPEPDEWSNVPKHIRHQRIAKRMGFTGALTKGAEPYFVPTNAPMPPGMRKSDWKHLMDAIGLALWGIKIARGGHGPGFSGLAAPVTGAILGTVSE